MGGSCTSVRVHLSTLTVRIMVDASVPENTSLIWGVVNPQQCNWDWPQSPGFQGWYILALSVWANITGDSDGSMTER